MAVMIGVDPHKGSHTAVATGADGEPLGTLRVRGSAAPAQKLVAWAAAWPERTWAVEGAGGLGHLLAQHLAAAGERVLDVPPKLAARGRLLEAGDTNNNDPSDALPVVIAALRSEGRRQQQQVRQPGIRIRIAGDQQLHATQPPTRAVWHPSGRSCSVTENDYPALTSCSRRVVSWLGRDGVTSVGRGHFHACQTISSATRIPTITTKFIPADIQAG
jgi:Transposase